MAAYPNASDFGPRACFETVTILSGQSLSNLIDIFGCSLTAIIIPATGWTSTSLTFQIGTAFDGSSQADLILPTGVEFVVTVNVTLLGNVITLDPDDFDAFRYVAVRSGTAGTPVPVSGNVPVGLIVRPVI